MKFDNSTILDEIDKRLNALLPEQSKQEVSDMTLDEIDKRLNALLS